MPMLSSVVLLSMDPNSLAIVGSPIVSVLSCQKEIFTAFIEPIKVVLPLLVILISCSGFVMPIGPFIVILLSPIILRVTLLMSPLVLSINMSSR